MPWGDGSTSGTKGSEPLSYRIMRRFYRFLTNIWFREINVVDDENLPPEGGILYITWHPSGLIDPMLMMATLPGRLTTIAKHTLFKIPVLGRMLKASGCVPIERPQDSKDADASRARNATMLDNISQTLASGGRALIFPEGVSHTDSAVRRVRSGAARMLLGAHRKAAERGLPKPHLVPIGLHYSESQTFRERAAVVVERAMEVPPVPSLVDDVEEQDRLDRAWVAEVTQAIEVELQRANLSKTSWRERTMIWKGRSLAYAEKQRLAGGKLQRPSYAESVLGARRLRAGWEYYAIHQPEDTRQFAQQCEQHFHALDRRNITPYDVDAKPERLTLWGHTQAFAKWLWALVWMFGLVTWSAIAGNYVPYKANGALSILMKRIKIEASVIGTIKVLSAVVFFPLWWMAASAFMTWSLLDASSPVNELLRMHWLTGYITQLPAVGVFLLFMVWWPASAKLHLKLYARLLRSSRDLKRWSLWNDEATDWEALVNTQRDLASRLVNGGTYLVLPGDEEWVDPPAGQDDVTVVRQRERLTTL